MVLVTANAIVWTGLLLSAGQCHSRFLAWLCCLISLVGATAGYLRYVTRKGSNNATFSVTAGCFHRDLPLSIFLTAAPLGQRCPKEV
jgi:hypothetical protein